MCRLVKECNAARGNKEPKVYGVLTDYDLSSRQKDLKGDYIQTSQQRTGTPPYMAQELLQRTSKIHLYRHDVESLFWIMLMMCGRHSIEKRGDGKEAKMQVVMREGRLPYEYWYNERNYTTLGLSKESFFTKAKAIELSPLFEDFRPWLLDLQRCFSQGFTSQLVSANQLKWAGMPTAVPFDDETLGGNISYSNIINSARSLKGKLAGLIVRYDPPITATPASLPSVGAAQADD
jgi:serine/threonine protein kinase